MEPTLKLDSPSITVRLQHCNIEHEVQIRFPIKEHIQEAIQKMTNAYVLMSPTYNSLEEWDYVEKIRVKAAIRSRVTYEIYSGIHELTTRMNTVLKPLCSDISNGVL